MDVTTRRSLVQEAVNRSGSISMADLCEEIGVSRVTVHRDLDYLASIGALERVRGGARSNDGARHVIKTEFNLRRAQMVQAKSAMAVRAVEEIRDGETIFLDSSTTCLALAMELQECDRSSLTLVTNSPAIAYQLHSSHIQIVMVPGDVHQSLRAVVGPWAQEFLAQLHLSTAFVSCAAFNPTKGMMTTQKSLAEMTKVIIDRSERTIGLIDSSKFEGSALLPMAAIGQIDLVISDSGLEPELHEKYRKAGVALALAPATDAST